ncbi:MAG: hypothetical protein WC459_02760 [Patescibacteria group bacterium]
MYRQPPGSKLFLLSTRDNFDRPVNLASCFADNYARAVISLGLITVGLVANGERLVWSPNEPVWFKPIDNFNSWEEVIKNCLSPMNLKEVHFVET